VSGTVRRVVVAALVLAIGWAVTGLVVDDAYERFDDADRRVVAADAMALAGTTCALGADLLTPVLPVTRAEALVLDPGHCTDGLGEPHLRDWRGRVRSYTLFAIPLRGARFTCGGAMIVC
jgi:hypothetical protein